MPRPVTHVDGPGTALTHVDEPALDERPTTADPFADMPSAGRLAVTFVLGLMVMIATLTAVGVVLTSTVALEAVRDWDLSISTNVAERRTSAAVDLARLITTAGDTMAILTLLAAITLVLAVLRKWRAMTFVPMAMLAEITTFLSVNHLVGRERPPVDKIGPLPGTFSFPSGHIAATLVCWVGIGVLLVAYGFVKSGLLVMIAGASMAAAMGWARVYAGMHYTIDVIFGFAMGVAALTLTVITLRVDVIARRNRDRGATGAQTNPRSAGGRQCRGGP
jgi:membrane-associated phospholipid phosphatase